MKHKKIRAACCPYFLESASGPYFVFSGPLNIYIIISKFIQYIMTIYNKRSAKATLVEADDKISQVFDIIYN